MFQLHLVIRYVKQPKHITNTDDKNKSVLGTKTLTLPTQDNG